MTFDWSHLVLVNDGERASPCIPDHEEARRGTSRGPIRTANLSIDESLAAIRVAANHFLSDH